ncbi:MAG: hypothetical protein JWP88_2270 [Flaviaesturariibacter sp.]|nr:hypothetical protein [Flaviaesturariibacter sp.]
MLNMLKYYLTAFLFIASFTSCETLSKLPGAMGSVGGISQAEAAEGLRQALDQGVGKGINFLNVKDGFFGNQAYKLFLPEEALKIEKTLRDLGMGGMVDRAILQINRGAEDAVGYARPIFINAIQNMSITDAINIVRGGSNSATTYFRQKTTDQLVAAFAPIIKESLDKFSATKYYGDLVNTYNAFPTTRQKINPDLTSYVVGKAVSALFDQVAKEEANIRTNVAARTTDVLKKVFGYASRGY